jgi:hypothetical protein
MKSAYAFCLLGVFACGSPAKSSTSDPTLGQAEEAIHALESHDSDAVQACGRQVNECEDKSGDAGSGACEQLEQHCQELADTLANVRGPAVSCWKTVIQCVRHGERFASEGDAGADAGGTCAVKPRDCRHAGDDADEERSPVLECGQAVGECFQSVKEHADDAREVCADVSDDCHHICGAAVEASHEPESHSGQAGPLKARMQELLQRLRDHRRGGHHGDDAADAGDH